jgi:hypothetical protein
MSDLDQKRQYLIQQNQKQLVRYKNRAYIQNNVVLLRDYIAQRIKEFEYFYKKQGYKVEPSNIDTITGFLFKPKNEQEEIDRENNELWDKNTSLALLPADTVIDKSSKFAYQYNYRYGISSKYFLLKTKGINSREDIEDNSYGQPTRITSVKVKRSIVQNLVYPKVEIIRYYYKGRQITKESAFETVIMLKNNIEQVTYKVNNTYRTIYINTKTDERVYKKNAFKKVIRLKKGVRAVKSYVRGKKQVIEITKRKSTVRETKYTKVNYFAQTYKNYLPYFLFVRLVKKEVKKRRKTIIEDRIKFYISTYVDINGNVKYIPSKIRNGRDIIANSDMIGNVVMPQILEDRSIRDMFKKDGRIREKQETDSAYIDTPVLFLFFVGQQNLSRPKRYRPALKDMDIIDVKNETDTGKMKDTSSLDINENKDYLTDIKTGQELKAQQQKVDIENILQQNEEYNRVERLIERTKEDLEDEKVLLEFLKKHRISKLDSKNISKVIDLVIADYNLQAERKQYIRTKDGQEKNARQLKVYGQLKVDLEDIDDIISKSRQNKLLQEFNEDRQETKQNLLERLENLKYRKRNIISKEKEKVKQEESKKIDTIQELEYGQKVNLLKRYYNKIVNEINTNNPTEIRG